MRAAQGRRVRIISWRARAFRLNLGSKMASARTGSPAPALRGRANEPPILKRPRLLLARPYHQSALMSSTRFTRSVHSSASPRVPPPLPP